MKDQPTRLQSVPCAAINDPDHRFIGWPMTVEYINGVDWRLKKELAYRTEKGETSTVRAGFVFDFASIPRPIQIIYPAAGDGNNCYGVAALFHDWLYCHRKIGGRVISRSEADALFFEIMRYVGCDKFTAYTMWLAVRSFGWIPWMRRKPEDIIP